MDCGLITEKVRDSLAKEAALTGADRYWPVAGASGSLDLDRAARIRSGLSLIWPVQIESGGHGWMGRGFAGGDP